MNVMRTTPTVIIALIVPFPMTRTTITVSLSVSLTQLSLIKTYLVDYETLDPFLYYKRLKGQPQDDDTPEEVRVSCPMQDTL